MFCSVHFGYNTLCKIFEFVMLRISSTFWICRANLLYDTKKNVIFKFNITQKSVTVKFKIIQKKCYCKV